MSEFKIILEGGSGELIEKKSRFIAYVKAVSSEKEAFSFIDEIKKRHWDAKHNCSAFVIGDNNEMTRCSDDGEPSGTAGRPMLDVLINEGIHNVCVVVTRYFGGVLLGTGGLIRAYQGAVKEGLSQCKFGKKTKGKIISYCVNYNDIGKILNLSSDSRFKIENIEYVDNVHLDVVVDMDNFEKIQKSITNITSGKAIVNDIVETDIITSC